MGFYCALMQIQDLKKTNHEVGIIGLGCSFKGGVGRRHPDRFQGL